LAKYHAELLLIGSMAWFDNKRRHLPTWLAAAKIMVLQTHTNFKKGEVQLTVSSTLPIQQAIAYSISCSKAEKETDVLQTGGNIKKGKNIHLHGPRTIPNICKLLDPPTFSLVPSFKVHNFYVFTFYL
jgi:hypothetical protein